MASVQFAAHAALIVEVDARHWHFYSCSSTRQHAAVIGKVVDSGLNGFACEPHVQQRRRRTFWSNFCKYFIGDTFQNGWALWRRGRVGWRLHMDAAVAWTKRKFMILVWFLYSVWKALTSGWVFAAVVVCDMRTSLVEVSWLVWESLLEKKGCYVFITYVGLLMVSDAVYDLLVCLLPCWIDVKSSSRSFLKYNRRKKHFEYGLYQQIWIVATERITHDYD